MSKDSEWFLFRDLPIGSCFHVSDDADQPSYRKISNDPVNNCTVDDHRQSLSLDFECRWVLTDEEIGKTIRWLCSLPRTMHIRFICDECEMSFGGEKYLNSEWDLQKNLQELILQRGRIDANGN